MVASSRQQTITYCLSPLAKIKGLLTKTSLPAGEYYVFPSCRAIHTFGMRFAIDVIFCNKEGLILKYCRQVVPNRIVFCRDAFFAIELCANEFLNQEQLKIIVSTCLKLDKSYPQRIRWI